MRNEPLVSNSLTGSWMCGVSFMWIYSEISTI